MRSAQSSDSVAMRGCSSFKAFAAALCLAVCVLAGCSQRGKVISREDMVDIYADMLIADQWLDDQGSSYLRKSDTTMFYEPIFNKYGYTTEDFRNSVYRYLDDPERYSKLLKKVEAKLQARADVLQAEIDGVNKERAEYEHWRKIYEPVDFYYPSRLADTLRVGFSPALDSAMRSITRSLERIVFFEECADSVVADVQPVTDSLLTLPLLPDTLKRSVVIEPADDRLSVPMRDAMMSTLEIKAK